jgi:serine O-acetyltransferase
MLENLRCDCARYEGQWYRRVGFWIMTVYRFGNWADSLPTVLLRVPMWILYLCLKIIVGLFSTNVFLWAGRRGARISRGFCFPHPFNILIPRGVEIGEFSTIYHEVTLGTGQIPGTPKIGNRVAIYPGARVLGGIVVGDGSIIGANCVVTRDVPPESVIIAAPAQVIPKSLSRQARRWSAGNKPQEPLSPSPPSFDKHD